MQKGNKIILIVSICMVIVFSTVALIVAFASGNSLEGENSNRGDVITKKETALKIGRALLAEHFPDTFLNTDEPIDAEEKDGIWIVYNVVERGGVTKGGVIRDVVGGELYVEFRKSDGKVIKIGVND